MQYKNAKTERSKNSLDKDPLVSLVSLLLQLIIAAPVPL